MSTKTGTKKSETFRVSVDGEKRKRKKEKVDCKEIEKWSGGLLVGAFLDLSVTYLLLCASAVCFVTSKFLSLFGSSLPCPCNGLFGDPCRVGKCWQRKLVRRPHEKLSSVRVCVRSGPPFDSILYKRGNENGCGGGALLGRDGKVRFIVRGKGVRFSPRRRRVDGSGDEKFPVVALDGSVGNGELRLVEGPDPSGEVVGVTREVCDVPVGSVGHDGGLSSTDVGMSLGVSVSSRSPYSDTRQTENDIIDADGLKYYDKDEIVFDGNERNTIRVLEKALKEEHAARAALYLELEKERSSAATATDEAMAMIFRLQEDKAAIEMEAKQFHRMMEEKSVYDSEEMDILKEILLRREREKHFLEKEVEAYRKMISDGEQLDFDLEGVTSSRNMSTFGDNQLEDVESRTEARYRETPINSFTLERESRIPELNKVVYLSQGHKDLTVNKLHHNMPTTKTEDETEAQDNELLSLEKSPFDPENEIQEVESRTLIDLSPAEGDDIHLKTVTLAGKQHYDAIETSQGLTSDRFETSDHDRTLSCNQDDPVIYGKDLDSSGIGMGPYFHDALVVDDEFDMNSEVRGNGKVQLISNSALNEPMTSESPVISRSEDISQSCSDASTGLPPKSGSGIRPQFSDLRRNSMSAVDCERLKLDNEVGLLRERLRIVQKGREKLSTSAGNKARDNTWLRRLDRSFSLVPGTRGLIASTSDDPTTTIYNDLLTPPSAKGTAEIKRWRSVSLGIHRSS